MSDQSYYSGMEDGRKEFQLELVLAWFDESSRQDKIDWIQSLLNRVPAIDREAVKANITMLFQLKKEQWK